MQKILIATDSFKGSKTSLEAAHLIRKGARCVFPHAEFSCIPIADGGEGTVEAIINSRGGSIHHIQVRGPLGQPVQAAYGITGSTAIVEISAASGLPLIPPKQRDILRASSYGSGELLDSILKNGYRHIIIGLGGSATNDGGAGIAQALGYSLQDKAGQEIGPGGEALKQLHKIDDSRVNPALSHARLEVICDVDNPLLGPEGASAVYGPQKGAGPEEIKKLDSALAHLAMKIRQWYPAAGKENIWGPCPEADFPGAGAAGGIGFGLKTLCGAEIKSGIETILSISGFNQQCSNADLVITGEGRIDGQSTRGKVPMGIAAQARRHNTPVLAIVGSMTPTARNLHEQGIHSIICLPEAPVSLEEAMARSDEYLPSAAERACRLIQIGMNIRIKKDN